MASQIAVHVQSALKVKRQLVQQQLQQLNVFARKQLTAQPHQLRKQENNHAATSTQKVS
jgi:hypothetical protein